MSLDANFRLKLAPVSVLVDQFERAAALADEVLIGRSEAALCAGSDDDAAVEAYVRSLPVDIAVLKGRSGGATAFSGDGRVDVPAQSVDVVDPVGAGDAFAVGFLHARLAGEALHGPVERRRRSGSRHRASRRLSRPAYAAESFATAQLDGGAAMNALETALSVAPIVAVVRSTSRDDAERMARAAVAGVLVRSRSPSPCRRPSGSSRGCAATSPMSSWGRALCWIRGRLMPHVLPTRSSSSPRCSTSA